MKTFFVGLAVLGFIASANARIWDEPPLVLPSSGPSLEETAHRPQIWDSRLSEVSCLAFSPDGKTLFVGGSDKKRDHQTRVLGFDVATGALRHDWTPPGVFHVAALSFSQNGRWLAIGTDEGSTGTRGGSVSLWDVANGMAKWVLPGAVDGLDLSADGRVLAVNDAGLIQIRDAQTGALKRSFWQPQEQNMFAVALSPDGRWCAVNTFTYFERDKDRLARITIALWDLKTGRFFRFLERGGDARAPMAFSRDGKFLVAPFGSGADVWDTTSWQKRTFDPKIELRRRLWFADGTQVSVERSSTLRENAYYLFNPRLRKRPYSLPSNSTNDRGWAISPDGTWLATIDESDLVEYDYRNSQEKPFARVHLWNVRKLWPEVVAGRAPSPHAAPLTAFLRWIKAVNEGDWNRAASYVEGAQPSKALQKTGALFRAGGQRLDFSFLSALPKGATAQVGGNIELVPRAAPSWSGRLRNLGKPGSYINRTSTELLTLRKTAGGWKIVPSPQAPPLWTESSALLSAVSFQIVHPQWNAQVPLRAQIVPEISNAREVARFVMEASEKPELFPTRQDMQRLFEGNTTAKIQSSPDSRDFFLLPQDPRRVGFWFNEQLLEQPKTALTMPDQTVIAFSSDGAQPKLDFRLAGRAVVVTADEKLHFVTPAQASEFGWEVTRASETLK